MLKKNNEIVPVQMRFPHRISNQQQFNNFIHHSAVQPYIPEKPPINTKTKILTIGSCFSSNVAKELSSLGLDVTNYDFSERMFSTFALLEFIEGVKKGKVSDILIDDLPENREKIQTIRDLLSEGVTVIFTLGLSSCWFDRKTNLLVHSIVPRTPEQVDAMGGDRAVFEKFKRYEMRQTSVEDNASNIINVIKTIKELNPNNKVILTVSPIPLQLSNSDQPLLTSDFLSKATLRMAISEIEKIDPDNVYYFPSFEIIRWALPHLNTDCWGTASTDGDPRHIDSGIIKFVIACFQKFYTDLD